MSFGRVVARTARKHGYAVIHRKSFRDLRGELGRRARVRRKIFVQKKNVHGLIRPREEPSLARKLRSQKIETNAISAAPRRIRVCGRGCRPERAHPSWCARN